MPVRLWGGPTTVNQSTASYQSDPDVATLLDGRVIVVWEDNSAADTRIMYRLFNSDGTPASAEIVAGTSDGNDLHNPVVTALDNGGWAIGYDNSGGAGNDLFRVYNAAGFSISTSVISGNLNNSYPEIINVGGTFWAVTVGSGVDNTITAYRFNSDTGSPQGSISVQGVTTGLQRNPAGTQLVNSDVVIAWRDGANIEFRIFNDAGVGLSAGDKLVTNGAVDAANDNWGKPDVLALENGGFLITWADNFSPFPGSSFDVWGQIYDRSGTASGSTFLMNSTVSSNQFNPVTVALKNGGFALLYATNVGANQDIRGQIFDISGTLIGTEFTVSADGANVEFDNLDATLLEDGRILVSWEQFNVDGSATAIVNQIIDPRNGSITGDTTDNTLYGGNSDDVIMASSGNDTVIAMDGKDQIFGGAGNDVLSGGGDNDEIYGQSGDDILNGDDGNDYLVGGLGNDVINGGAGIDTASYESAVAGVNIYLMFTGTDTIGSGIDTLVSIENLTGSVHDDRLIADSNDNVLTGGDGNDVLKGKGGNDVFYGGNGNDKMVGGSGNDTMFGGAGSDTLIALSGLDILNGGDGDDFLFGGQDDDVLNGDAGNDNIRGNRGKDTINGGDGSDILRGGGQNDIVNGGDGNDFLFGENQSDILFGGAGDDSLTGGSGGGIADAFTDTFVYKSTGNGGGGFDRIKDFDNGTDVIDIRSFGYASFGNVLSLANNVGVNMRLNFGGGDILFIENFQLADFDISDVLI